MSQDTELGLAMFLVERGLLTSEQLQKALEQGGEFETVLVTQGFVTQEQLSSAHAALGRGRTDLIPGYEIIEKIGQGGMGAVYRAKQLSLDRTVAIKVLLPKIALDPGAVERFLGEVKTIAQLSHPNLVAGIDAGYRHGLYYCVMEYIEGRTLTKVMNVSSPVPWKEAVQIARQIGSALKHAHRQSIVHRDVKPDNILIDKTGAAKLMDLGLARLETLPPEAHSTQVGQLAGTPMYMSPEQAKGQTDIDHRSDIYSLGLTLYEMLCGHQPFEGSSQMLLLAARINSEPRYALLKEASITEPLAAVVRKMTAREREKRYQDMDEALADMDALLKHKPMHTTTQKLARRSTKTRILPPDALRRKSSPAAAIVLVIVVIFGGLGLFLVVMTSSPPPRPPVVKHEPPTPISTPAPQPAPVIPVAPVPADEDWKAVLRIESELQNPEVILVRYLENRDRFKGSGRAADLEKKIADMKKRVETNVRDEREALQAKVEKTLAAGKFDESSGELSAAGRKFTMGELQKQPDMPEYAGWVPAIRAMESKVREKVSATVTPMCEQIKELCRQGKVGEAAKVYEKIKALGAEPMVRELTAEAVKILKDHESRAEKDALEAKNDEWNIERAWKAARDLALVRDFDGAVKKLHETRAGVKSASQRPSIEELCRDMEQVREAARTKGGAGTVKFLLALYQGDDAAAAKELAGLKSVRPEYTDLYERVKSRAEEVRGMLKDADQKYANAKTKDEALQIYNDILENHAAVLPEATLKQIRQKLGK